METKELNKPDQPQASAAQVRIKYKQFMKVVDKRVAHKPAEFRAYIAACIDQLQDNLEEMGVL